jgi:hypothetical protein
MSSMPGEIVWLSHFVPYPPASGALERSYHLPCVATQAAVEALSLVESEHYLRAESVEAFVAPIRRLEGDGRLRRRLGEAGRALVQHEYDWSVVGVPLDTAYADAAARGTAPW